MGFFYKFPFLKNILIPDTQKNSLRTPGINQSRGDGKIAYEEQIPHYVIFLYGSDLAIICNNPEVHEIQNRFIRIVQ